MVQIVKFANLQVHLRTAINRQFIKLSQDLTLMTSFVVHKLTYHSSSDEWRRKIENVALVPRLLKAKRRRGMIRFERMTSTHVEEYKSWSIMHSHGLRSEANWHSRKPRVMECSPKNIRAHYSRDGCALRVTLKSVKVAIYCKPSG